MSIGILHSAAFVARWRDLLVALYGYRVEASGAMRVPGLPFGTTSVYVPLLSYSDISLATLKSESRSWGNGSAYQVRVLDLDATAFQANDTVTMRLDIAGSTVEALFSKRITPKCRNHVRKAEKSGLELRAGSNGQVMLDFYKVFAGTMHRHGTPVFTRRLFELMPDFVDTRFLVAYHEGAPVAGLCQVSDGALSWIPWAGSEPEYRAMCPSHLVYWRAIQDAVAAGQSVFDFGRSGYSAPTFVFKQGWGAQPVKIATVSDQPQDLYGKYTAAADIWQRLPAWLVNWLGPKVCRYLPDL